MFMNACTGCVEIPAPIYYWNPFVAQAYSKSSAFQIANILQLSQTAVDNARQTKRARAEMARGADHEDERHELLQDKRHRESDLSDDRSQNRVLDFTKKSRGKCTAPSALEPLQALCSVGPRAYRSSSPCSAGGSHSTKSSTSPSRDLKFGISNILSENFGKERNDKENSPARKSDESSTRRHLDACECTYDACHYYKDHMRYPSHALSAVHAIQPPKYPTSSSGTDILPGPYSVLNTDVSIGPQSKRKRSWSRAVFSNLQRKGLEKRFEVQKYVTKPDRRQLAAMLGLTDAQVKVWFQNRRMKWRHAQQQMSTERSETTGCADDKSSCADDKEILTGTVERVNEDFTNEREIDSDDDNDDVIMSSDDEDISVTDVPETDCCIKQTSSVTVQNDHTKLDE
ncbi:hypothetical protein ACF0H5_002441 [Mactra antiquata]